MKTPFLLFLFIFIPLIILSGWSAEIYWHTDKKAYSPGETANISLSFKNTGNEVITILYVRLYPDWGHPTERNINITVMPRTESNIGLFQLKIPENASKGWHTVLILLKMKTTTEFSWEVPMPLEIVLKGVKLNCSALEEAVSCDLTNEGSTMISGKLLFYNEEKGEINITLNPGESRNIVFPAEGNVTVIFLADGIEKKVNISVFPVKLLFISYKPVIQGYMENISVAVNCSSKASIYLEVDGKRVDEVEVGKGTKTVFLKWKADKSGDHKALIGICSTKCFNHEFNITVFSRDELENLLILFKGIKEMEKLGGKSYICEKAEEDLLLLNETGDPNLLNKTKEEVNECFLYLKSSICNSLGNSTNDPDARKIIDMARKSEKPEDFIRNISSIKVERRMPLPYLLLSVLAVVSIAMFLALRERRKGFKRKYKGFKYKKAK